jgi:hypothetical protein
MFQIFFLCLPEDGGSVVKYHVSLIFRQLKVNFVERRNSFCQEENWSTSLQTRSQGISQARNGVKSMSV